MSVTRLPLFRCKHCGRKVALIYAHLMRHHKQALLTAGEAGRG